jgi:hypothetical protein
VANTFKDCLDVEAGAIGSAHTGINTARQQIRQRPTGSLHIGPMRLDLSDEETAALIQELHDIVESEPLPIFAAYPHAERHPGEVATRAGPQALAAAQSVCTAAS